MTKDELIAKQQIEIEELRQKISEHKKIFKNIRGIIYGIGGPLNDNKLGYTRPQMKIFWDIMKGISL